MTTKERITVALEGGVPDITPYTTYMWTEDLAKSPEWRPLIDAGLGMSYHCGTVHGIEHGVEDGWEDKQEGANRYLIHTRTTPIGALRQVWTNGWHTESFIKTPADYRTMQWIVEHTEYVPAYENFAKAEAEIGDDGIVLVTGSRSPAMSLNLDWAGTQQFCQDVALEVPELYDLYEARKKTFREEIRLLAAGPGRFVKWFENLTISMLGPARYEELLLSVYQETVPLLEAGGKRLMVHYDGALQVIADLIARAPFHMIESLTEPPEGDMTYDQCRAAWPDKVFWGNLNIHCYDLPPEQLRAEVIAKCQRAGKRGFLLEISEDVPGNLKTAVPVVLETLASMANSE